MDPTSTPTPHKPVRPSTERCATSNLQKPVRADFNPLRRQTPTPLDFSGKTASSKCTFLQSMLMTSKERGSIPEQKTADILSAARGRFGCLGKTAVVKTNANGPSMTRPCPMLQVAQDTVLDRHSLLAYANRSSRTHKEPKRAGDVHIVKSLYRERTLDILLIPPLPNGGQA